MIGKRIKEARKRKNLTQSQLAEKIKMTPQAIQRIEDGLVAQPRKLKQIADALEVKEEYLLTGKIEYLQQDNDLNKIDYDKQALLLIMQRLTSEQVRDLLEQAKSTADKNENIMKELLGSYQKLA